MTSPGPDPYRLAALARQAAAQVQQAADRAIGTINGSIEILEATAGQYEQAVRDSIQDRANLWTAVTALTDRVAALETAVAALTPPAPPAGP